VEEHNVVGDIIALESAWELGVGSRVGNGVGWARGRAERGRGMAEIFRCKQNIYIYILLINSHQNLKINLSSFFSPSDISDLATSVTFFTIGFPRSAPRSRTASRSRTDRNDSSRTPHACHPSTTHRRPPSRAESNRPSARVHLIAHAPRPAPTQTKMSACRPSTTRRRPPSLPHTPCRPSANRHRLLLNCAEPTNGSTSAHMSNASSVALSMNNFQDKSPDRAAASACSSPIPW
jgi:hypothetical protein